MSVWENRTRRLSRAAERAHPIRIERPIAQEIAGKAAPKHRWELVTEAFAAVLNSASEEVIAAKVQIPETARIFLVRGLLGEVDNTMRVVYAGLAHPILDITNFEERSIEWRISTRAGTQMNQEPA